MCHNSYRSSADLHGQCASRHISVGCFRTIRVLNLPRDSMAGMWVLHTPDLLTDIRCPRAFPYTRMLILRDLGVRTMKLMTNNTAKYGGLSGYGFGISGRVPLLTPIAKENRRYLETKRVRMRHIYGSEFNGQLSNFIQKTMPSVGLPMASGTIGTRLPGCAFVFLLKQHTYKESWWERNNGD
ncbi:riboflavin biosynthesis protein [Musa troglodytarum]|uniref:3,4-dihydroxy-2-butanone-4-phosphate synthase n=1 Tax=Musa troglodytarum TaxID=320322 RepID=A0A9E7KEE0_9LILI|nr:riboflavin biosynthesis protein [Musa troglodytarum]